MKFTFVLAVILIAVDVNARIVDLYPFDNDELWDRASVVALVRIVEGGFTEDPWSFKVKSSVRFVAKGEPTTELSFSGTHPYRLSGLYLIYLEEGESGGYETIIGANAVVEVFNPITEFDDEKDKELWGEFIDIEQMVRFLNEPYLPTSCYESELKIAELCDVHVGVLKSTLNKHRQRGRANRAPLL